eukprot:356407_1
MSTRRSRRDRKNVEEQENRSKSRKYRQRRMSSTSRGRLMEQTLRNINPNNNYANVRSRSPSRSPSKTPQLTKSPIANNNNNMNIDSKYTELVLNLDNGTDVSQLITPSSITTHQYQLLQDKIANKYIQQQQNLDEDARKRAAYARSFIKKSNNSTENIINGVDSDINNVNNINNDINNNKKNNNKNNSNTPVGTKTKMLNGNARGPIDYKLTYAYN